MDRQSLIPHLSCHGIYYVGGVNTAPRPLEVDTSLISVSQRTAVSLSVGFFGLTAETRYVMEHGGYAVHHTARTRGSGAFVEIHRNPKKRLLDMR